MDIYIKFLENLTDLVEDYKNAKTNEDQLEALRALADESEQLTLDATDEANSIQLRLEKESADSISEQDEAYRGQY